jgi:hypothetical protein
VTARAWPRRVWRRLRFVRAASRRSGEALREFVYLDEVSVFSLISSRVGGVATEFTDTQSQALRTEITTSAAAGAGLFKADVRSGAESTRSAQSQVLRKATVQGTFRELYGKVEDDLLLRPPAGPPAPVRADELPRPGGCCLQRHGRCRLRPAPGRARRGRGRA